MTRATARPSSEKGARAGQRYSTPVARSGWDAVNPDQNRHAFRLTAVSPPSCHHFAVGESWEICNFSLFLPGGQVRSEVPALLRHLADHLEEFGPIEERDLVMRTDVTAEGYGHHFTVYFHTKDSTEDQGSAQSVKSPG